jgi:glutamate synthase domain-containing protein 2
VFQLWLHNYFTRRSATLPYYPFAVKIKTMLSFLHPRIAKMVVAPAALINSLKKEEVALINKRSQNMATGLISNNLSYPFDAGYECVVIGQNSITIPPPDFFVEIGAGNCRQPYQLQLLNIGAVNCRGLGNNAVLSLSSGAKIAGCAINTGVLGINPYLLRGGGEQIWRISRFDFFCRAKNGSFNEANFQITATRPYIKMIEIEISLDDIPRAGSGLTFYNMIYFLQNLKKLSGGKPMGICLRNPTVTVLSCVCKTMFDTGICLDFITIENAPVVKAIRPERLSKTTIANFSGSIAAARKCIDRYNLSTKVIASADIVTEYDILRCIALGASACFSIKPMAAALNTKPLFGKPSVALQQLAVANFYKNTLCATIKLMEACNYYTLNEVKAADFYQKTTLRELKTLQQLYVNDSQPNKALLLTSLN